MREMYALPAETKKSPQELIKNQELADKISAATTIDELVDIIDKAGGIYYSDGTLQSAKQLKKVISELEKDEEAGGQTMFAAGARIKMKEYLLRHITRTAGLRSKVRELMYGKQELLSKEAEELMKRKDIKRIH
jgi:hypothetical protein